MSEFVVADLFGKLNELAYKSIEGTFTACKLRGSPYVELVHWVNQICNHQDSDIHRVLAHFEIDASRLSRDLVNHIEQLPGYSGSVPRLSDDIRLAIERAWLFATLHYKDQEVRTGYLLIALLKTPMLRERLLAMSSLFAEVKTDTLFDEFAAIVAGSSEEGMSRKGGVDADGNPAQTDGDSPALMGKREALARYTTNMTEQARKAPEPIVGRDEEIRQMESILMRRRQNNPILTGEAGVGKTAVVEGFAQRIAKGDVCTELCDVDLLLLDIGLLQAGASMKGEFENRLRQVIDEVKISEKPIILFIDEAHTLIGAGGSAGTGDAANLLKPALARGELRTIAATTWSEYKKYIEKDPALTRRFQVVKVEEPDESRALLMMRGIAGSLEQHHKVRILDAALEASVNLSHRYIPGRQLPDKSVSLLDTAAARVAISQNSVPASLDDCRRQIQALETEQRIVVSERQLGLECSDREEAVSERLATAQSLELKLRDTWEREKSLVETLLDLRTRLKAVDGADNDLVDDNPENSAESAAIVDGDQIQPSVDEVEVSAEELVGKIRQAQGELNELQGEEPLVHPLVDEQAVATVVQDWTGVPVGKMLKDEIQSVLSLADLLEERIVGQRHALEIIAKRIQTARAGLDNPVKPLGVFMLAGSSGVGKTETALALAEVLYGGEQNVITINMSEFQEPHTVSTLKGAPPGYVGYGEGGVLTEAVRRQPHSIVLLDEIEKAHPDVRKIFMQVFDKGVMEDGEGRSIDFRNTLILLTTNAGTEAIVSMCSDPDTMPEPQNMGAALRKVLLNIKEFPTEFLGRLILVPYYPLNDDMIYAISRLQLKRIQQRIQQNHDIELTYDDGVLELIASRCKENESGGRMIDAILTNTLLPSISQELLERQLGAEQIGSIRVSVESKEFSYEYAEPLASDSQS